jgi:Uma2 family endonuclease
MSTYPTTFITEEEYLAIEREAATRSEYFAGETFALAGATRPHNRIVTNLVSELDSQLKDRLGNVYSSDMRVRVRTGLYTYPDVVVTCGEEVFADGKNDTLLNPVVIIEVLSQSTEAYDRGKKFEHYQRLESLAEYLLVAQQLYRVEQFLRQADGSWLYREAHSPGDVVVIESIGCRILLKDIYRKV